MATPERTATSLFQEVQQRYPGLYADGQHRTLEQRVKEWRDRTILTFDTEGLHEEALAGQTLPRPLRVDSSLHDVDARQPTAVGQ